MDPRDPLDQANDELDVLLIDPAFVERTVTSDPFIDWNLENAINGIHVSRETGAKIFLQLHPHYILELRDTRPALLPLVPPNLPVPSDLLDLWRSFQNSDWYRNNEHEPKKAGHSVLMQMLLRQSDPADTQPLWICAAPSLSQPDAICRQGFRRWDRAITHIRAKHLNHRPFPCGGDCGVPTWCVAP